MDDKLQPFVGPRPFEKADKEVFFGRDHETTELLSLIVAHPVVLLYAQSGAGKTSMLNAGLIPALEKEGLEVFPPARVSGADIYETGPDSIPNVFIFNALTRWIDDSQEPEELHRLSLAEFLASRDHIKDEDGLPALRVIIFDQFEEIFTYHQEFREHRKAFFDQIRIAIEGERGKRPKSGQLKVEQARSKGDSLLRVLLVIREDYLAQMDAYAPQLPEKLRTRFRIERLREEAALAAVTGPLRMTNSRRVFAPGVAERLVKDLTKINIETFAGYTEVVMGEFVEPVQLQVVCRRLLEAIPEDVTEITEENLQDFGDVGHALLVFYEECLEKAVSKTGVKEASLRIWFERTLITPAGTRGTVFIGQSDSGTTPLSAVKVLEDLHLIRGEWRAGAKWYELTHDRLIEPIQESNRKWMAGRLESEQILQRLEAKAAEWVRLGRSYGGLLDAVELLEVERAMANPNAAAMSFSGDLEALIKKSREAIEKARLEKEAASKRELKLARRASITLFALIVIGIAVAVYLYIITIDQSKQQRLSQLLAAQSIPLLDEKTDLALLLSIEAFNTDPTIEARSSMLTGLGYCSNITSLLHGHNSPINSVAFSSDGKMLASGSGDDASSDDDPSVILWDIDGNKQSLTLHKSQTDVVRSVAFSPDGKMLATSSSNPVIKLWDTDTGNEVRAFAHIHTKQVNSVAFSPDGNLLASGGDDNLIVIWGLKEGLKESEVIAGHSGSVTCVAFSPDGKYLASASQDKSVILWDVATRKQIWQSSKGHFDVVTSVAFSPDGKTLASGGLDKKIVLWTVSTGEIKPLATLQFEVLSLAFSPDNRTLASGSKEGVKVWDIPSGLGEPLLGNPGSINSIAFTPDGNSLASGGDEQIVTMWSVTPQQKLAQPLSEYSGAEYGDADSVIAVFRPDGTELILAGWYAGVAVWDFQARELKPLYDPKASIYSIAYSPDGSTLAWGLNSGEIILFDVASQRQAHTLAGHKDRVTALAFSPNSKTLASGSRDKSVLLWDLATLTARGAPLKYHSDVISGLAFSPDGEKLASSSWDNSVKVLDVATGTTRVFGTHTDRVKCVAFSPDGYVIASGGQDKSIILWDVGTGEDKRFTGSNSAVNSLAFSPDGKTLASGGGDKGVTLWDVNSSGPGTIIRKLGGPLASHNAAINSLAFSPDGKTLASGSGAANAVILWDMDYESWARRMCSIANRNMNDGEWEQYMGKKQERKTCPELP